jgi:hypothetical protein
MVVQHVCDHDTCSNILHHNTETNVLDLVPNPDFQNGQCPLHHRLFPTMVDLSSYSFTNPRGMLGKLYQVDKIVIPDSEFKIVIDFPLNNPHTITIRGKGDFTLRDVLLFIKLSYEKIYKEEEETCTEQEYVFQRNCECRERPIQSFLTNIPAPHEYTNNECCICYSTFESNNISKLPCGHMFDTLCITNWTNTSKHTCPLCRQSIIQCTRCNGTGLISYTQRYKVIPTNLRSDIFRNNTNGIHGIYQYDFEHLMVEYMVYNRYTKQLRLQMNVF